MDKSINKIYETKNYSQFVLKNWNRDISQKNISKIEKSVKINGWRPEPIIVNEEKEIIDGQHRFWYAKEHNLPIAYMILDGLTKDDCKIMNACRTGWSSHDYIKHYSNLGNPNFIRLKNLTLKYPYLNISILVGVAKTSLNGNAQSWSIRDGSLKISEDEYNQALEILNWLDSFHKYVDAVSGRKAGIYCAIVFCYHLKNVDRERLKKRIIQSIQTIIPPANLECALIELEKVYNYKIPSNKYVFIHTEYLKNKKRLKMEEN